MQHGIDSTREHREYFVPDFSNWKDHDSYTAAFERLVRDLKAQPDAKAEAQPAPQTAFRFQRDTEWRGDGFAFRLKPLRRLSRGCHRVAEQRHPQQLALPRTQPEPHTQSHEGFFRGRS